MLSITAWLILILTVTEIAAESAVYSENRWATSLQNDFAQIERPTHVGNSTHMRIRYSGLNETFYVLWFDKVMGYNLDHLEDYRNGTFYFKYTDKPIMKRNYRAAMTDPIFEKYVRGHSTKHIKRDLELHGKSYFNGNSDYPVRCGGEWYLSGSTEHNYMVLQGSPWGCTGSVRMDMGLESSSSYRDWDSFCPWRPCYNMSAKIWANIEFIFPQGIRNNPKVVTYYHRVTYWWNGITSNSASGECTCNQDCSRCVGY